MKEDENQRNLLNGPTMDLRTKKRRAGEAVRVFEEIIDRPVTPAGTSIFAKRPPRPRFVSGRPHEIVLWEASDP